MLAGVALVGGLVGSVNLMVDGMLIGAPTRWVYGLTMGLLATIAVLLLLRGRVTTWDIFWLVLDGDLVYIVVTQSIEDPIRHASPLMLLVPAVTAAWFLGPWHLGVNMLITTAACYLGLSGGYDMTLDLIIQVVLSAGTLNACALGVFVLRRRVQRLLATTQELSHLDPLTGLFNRRYLAEQAHRLWRQARRDGSRLATMVLDLDHFKQLNDTHGHAAGDAVLQAVALALRSTVRPADVLARTGGEELVVVGQVSDSYETAHLAERLRTAVEATATGDGHRVTVSIGIVLTRPGDGVDAADALWRAIDGADAAMYEAKRLGRNRIAMPSVPAARRSAPPMSSEAATGDLN